MAITKSFLSNLINYVNPMASPEPEPEESFWLKHMAVLSTGVITSFVASIVVFLMYKKYFPVTHKAAAVVEGNTGAADDNDDEDDDEYDADNDTEREDANKE